MTALTETEAARAVQLAAHVTEVLGGRTENLREELRMAECDRRYYAKSLRSLHPRESDEARFVRAAERVRVYREALRLLEEGRCDSSAT